MSAALLVVAVVEMIVAMVVLGLTSLSSDAVRVHGSVAVGAVLFAAVVAEVEEAAAPATAAAAPAVPVPFLSASWCGCCSPS